MMATKPTELTVRTLSLLIACSSVPLRSHLRALLNREGVMRLCGEADTGANTLDLFWRYRPDVVMVDVCLADQNGFKVVESIKRAVPECRVVLLCHAADSFIEEVARIMGADYVCHTANGLNPILELLRELSGTVT